MIEVKNRSEEAWGPLAKCNDKTFAKLVNGRHAKDEIKTYLKKQKKLKTYKVQFKKVWQSDYFEIQANDEYSVSTAARLYFKENEDKIGFKEQPRSKWSDSYAGYDTMSYVKVK